MGWRNQELRIIIDRLLLDKKNMIKQLNLIAERLKNKEMNDE
jgi:hypothetical protein